ncbi:hypothetical protein FJW07_30765 [Mesorhizobium sp. B3-1-9]|uniref:hypothetical protein n=1 Tax=Mesorhizobium sp. B3-1-9 TaxID=2589892 RepID=UPI001166D046|nr:hypothetical protein [Mesorhizobium sp. B3-1-9]TPI28805.1 hypothetical protein FJW07_30765 [Mesorhizobium sp. B3-1-9]
MVFQIAPADAEEAPAVAAKPTCDELVQGGNYFHGEALEDLGVAQIDALLEVARACNPESSTLVNSGDLLGLANYGVSLRALVSNLEDARKQASRREQEQAKTEAGKKALIKLAERARMLPPNYSSEAALHEIKAEMFRIRNETAEVWESDEWRELDNTIDQKADAIRTADAQPANPSSNPPALQNFANQSSADTRISEMTCSVRGTAILGVPNMGSEDPENEVEVGLTSAGDFIVQGKQIAAVDVVRNGGTITFSMISVEDYLLAGSKDATGAPMGLSEDENMQFQAMQKMFIGGALNGRKRFAIYDVANSRLSFADADREQFKNVTAANCMAN